MRNSSDYNTDDGNTDDGFNADDGFDFEQMLRQTAQAENVGVFDRTPVDPAALLGVTTDGGRPGVSRWWIGVTRVGAPLAACVAIWFGFQFATQEPSQTSMVDAQPASENCKDLTLFSHCFTGPRDGPLDGGCLCVDMDRDGDVDLVDFAHFQRLVKTKKG